MIQRGRGTRLLLEAMKPARVAGNAEWNDFDGDLAPESRIAPAIDFAHPAGPERAENLKRTESRAGCEGQTRWAEL